MSTRGRILGATLVVVQAQGLAGNTTKEIARAAELSQLADRVV